MICQLSYALLHATVNGGLIEYITHVIDSPTFTKIGENIKTLYYKLDWRVLSINVVSSLAVNLVFDFLCKNLMRHRMNLFTVSHAEPNHRVS